ncbi:MAG: SusC/RagA family TonB-linked outer membrane protein [bacterium]|jgi:TonB-linked SusC/RagA family outer membrane protein
MRIISTHRAWFGLMSFMLLLGLLFSAVSPSFAAGTTGISSNAFDKIVKGRITDASGAALSGASISVKGSSVTALSDASGNYSISVPDDKTVLVISFVGFADQEIVVGNRTAINITLQSSSSELTQVVVVGYGTQRKKDVTGAVKTVAAEQFNRGIINAPQQLLQGKVAGVNVTSASGEPGGAQGITIRGPGGLRTGSTPLFVVDGLPLDNSSTGGGDPLNFINPADIESMDVLKDASATAIYGARGANGVILITTKKGKAGVSTMNYSSSLAVSEISRMLPVFGADQFRKEVVALGGVLDDKGAETDWQKVITRTAYTQNHNLTMSGGADKLTYFASFGLQKQQGIIKTNDLDRYSGRFNATQKFLNDRLIVDVNLSANVTKNRRPNIGAAIGDAISNNPTFPAYDETGEIAAYQVFNNPLLTFKLDKDITTINRVIGNISPTLKLFKGLSYKMNFGVDNSTATRDFQSLPNLLPVSLGSFSTTNSINRNTLIENYLTYNLNLKDHSISALGGHSYQEIFLQGRSWSINKFPITPVEPMYNPGIGQELTLANNKPTGYAVNNELQSFFSRVNYAYKDKYLATVNFRMDGSSKFGANNKYGYFPSFSLGWRITEEDFMKNSPFSNLKLRAGWGQTGNQEIPSKITQPLYTAQVSGTASYPLDNTATFPAGITYSRLANPDIQWEVSTQTNVGLDFGFFKGALSGSIDYFRKVSNNILLEVVPADPIQPASSVWTNVKDMTIVNTGLEIDLQYKKTTASGLRYSFGGNVSFLDNIVNNSPYSVITSGSASGPGLSNATVNGYVSGQPIGTFFLREWTGVDANGMNVFKDANGDGQNNDKDRLPMGYALPKVIYAFFGSFDYKGFDMVVNFNGVSGNKIYDNTANANFYKLRLSKGVNSTAEALSTPGESATNSAPVSSRYLKDGAFLRLNNLAIGYSINTRSSAIGKWISGLRFSVTGQNLFVVTKYDGYDPEVNADRQINGITSYGVDMLSYPKARSIIFGLNLTF